MSRVFLRKQFSNYLGENRAIDDIIVRFIADGPSPSPTPTPTPSITPSITPSVTPSITPTNTPTRTLTPTPSITPTLTNTPTNTQTPSITPTKTGTPTPTPTLTPTATSIPPLEYHLLAENDDNIMTENNDYLDIDITSQYKAILDYATTLGYTLPGPALQGEQNAIIQGFLDAGLWDNMDTFYVFINNDPTLEQFSRLNWITPSANTITTSGTTNYGISGYTFNGTNQYLDTNYIPSVNGVKYTLSSCSRFIYKCDADTDDSVLDGNVLSVDNSNNTNHSFNSGTSNTTNKVNRPSQIINSFQDMSGGPGLIVCGVSGASKNSRNASGAGSSGPGSGTALPTNNQFICRVGFQYGTHIIGFYGMGDFTSYSNYTEYNNIITNYINNII
jgi:hypothetical protein